MYRNSFLNKTTEQFRQRSKEICEAAIAVTHGILWPGDAAHLILAGLLEQDLPILEIGCYAGLSTTMLALTNPKRRVVTIDPEPHPHFISLLELYPNIEWVDGYSPQDIPSLKAGLVFLDGKHDKKSVLKDLTACWPLLEIGGLLMLHDWDTEKGVEEGWKAFVEQGGPLYEDIPHENKDQAYYDYDWMADLNYWSSPTNLSYRFPKRIENANGFSRRWRLGKTATRCNLKVFKKTA